MEKLSSPWLSEMEDPKFIDHCEMYSFDELTKNQISAALGEDFQQSFTSESFSSYSPFNPSNNKNNNTTTSSMERPTKQLETDSWNSCITKHIWTPKGSSSPSILSFGNPNSITDPQQFSKNLVVGAVKPKEKSAVNQNYASKASQGNKRASRATTMSSSYVQDHHINAERKRRERLSQQFIALSAIVPGLKKLDKASVLGDAIKYLKQLQERVKTLEEQTTKKTMESVVFVKKSKLSTNDNTYSSDGPLPEIEARVSDKNVLIRIHCEKHKGILVKILSEIEKLHLTVVNSSAMPFGNSILDITVIAQMDVEFCMTMKDLVKNLRSGLLLVHVKMKNSCTEESHLFTSSF